MRVLGEWILLPQRIAVYEPSGVAVVADVHLGYSAARRRQGDAIPARSVREELQPLIEAAQSHELRELIVAGDLFERGYDVDVAGQFLDVLAELRIRLVGVVLGNHDRGLGKGDSALPTFPDGFDLDGWLIVHGDQRTGAAKTVMGHWHPALRWRGRKRASYLVGKSGLVLPAFSLDAAGVDVRRDANWKDWQCYPICAGAVIKGKVINARGLLPGIRR